MVDKYTKKDWKPPTCDDRPEKQIFSSLTSRHKGIESPKLLKTRLRLTCSKQPWNPKMARLVSRKKDGFSFFVLKTTTKNSKPIHLEMHFMVHMGNIMQMNSRAEQTPFTTFNFYIYFTLNFTTNNRKNAIRESIPPIALWLSCNKVTKNCWQ